MTERTGQHKTLPYITRLLVSNPDTATYAVDYEAQHLELMHRFKTANTGPCGWNKSLREGSVSNSESESPSSLKESLVAIWSSHNLVY